MAGSDSPLHAYVEAARRRIGRLDGPGEASWREIVDRGFGEAYANGDISGLTRVVQLVAHLLETEGRFDAILAEIDLALAVTANHPGAEASLLALKASVLPTFGRNDEARSVAATAAELANENLHGEARLKTLTLVESVRLVILDPPSQTLPRLLGELVAEGRDLDLLFLLSWLVPYHAAKGEVEAARAQIRRMRAIARAQESRLREADAAVFERWQHVVAGTAMLLDQRVDRRAHIPAWRDAWLDLWVAILHRNLPAAEIAVGAVDRRSARLGPHTGSGAHWEAFFAAASTGTCPEGLRPTPVSNLTLDALPSNLAAALAVAIGGSVDDARTWNEWLVKVRRRGVASSIELPVSLLRVHGMIALRAGKAMMARRHLDDAAADTRGLPVESAIAAIQAFELRAKTGVSQPPDSFQLGHTRLLELGMDPVPFQLVIHRAWDTGRAAPKRSVLTPRERDVLRQLELGQTYKGAAVELGITWKTVQTIAHRSYGKLGARNRSAAIGEARRQGLL